MAKKSIPSMAQVRLLAHVWLTGEAKVGGYESSTLSACVKRGWLEPNGETGKWPNGSEYRVHVLSLAGFDAIEDYLREVRYKRATPRAA